MHACQPIPTAATVLDAWYCWGRCRLVFWFPSTSEQPHFCSAGTGYAVLHCHILPHEDEGCMMKTHLLESRSACDTCRS